MSAADLVALLSVQDLDIAIDQQVHRRRTLPERAELAAIDAEAVSLGQEQSQAEAGRDQIGAREAQVEAELSATEERAASVSKRLYGGEVSASRELQAMAADLDSLKARASDLEDQGLALLEEREPFDARLREIGSRLAALDERREAATDGLAASEAVVDADITELESRRKSAAEGIPDGLLTTYEQLRKRLGGVGAARLIGTHCDGCHLTLSAVEIDRIRHLVSDEIITCEQCSRILVPTGISS